MGCAALPTRGDRGSEAIEALTADQDYLLGALLAPRTAEAAIQLRVRVTSASSSSGSVVYSFGP